MYSKRVTIRGEQDISAYRSCQYYCVVLLIFIFLIMNTFDETNYISYFHLLQANAGDATLQPGYGQVQVLVELCSKGYVDVSFGTQLHQNLHLPVPRLKGCVTSVGL